MVIDQLRKQLGNLMLHVGADGVTDLILNADGNVWAHRIGEGKAIVGRMSPDAAETFIATVASTVDAVVGRDAPILECELPSGPPFYGARIEALIRPVVTAPSFAIRFHAKRIWTLDDLVAQGILTPGQRAILRRAARDRLNVLISGGTGSGKTTTLNAYIAEISRERPEHRQIIAQDTNELQCGAPDHEMLRANDQVSQQRLLKVAMRMAPDRLIVGEVRGKEAHDLLKGWNTGHDGGASTVHANSAREAVDRIEDLIAEAGVVPQRRRLAAVLHVIVHIAKDAAAPAGRRVKEVVSLAGLGPNGEYVFNAVE